jgi:GxxExxY protein
MPVECAIYFARLEREEFQRMDYRVMACAFASHGELGRNCTEEIYRNDLMARLEEEGVGSLQSEVLVRVRHDVFVKDYRLDLVVAEGGIYELKVAKGIAEEHEGQTLNYLLMTDCAHGKVINLHSNSVESRFVNNPLSHHDRCRYTVSVHEWRGPGELKRGLLSAVEDLGLFLETALYNQILIHHFGGPEIALQSHPLIRRGRILGSQLFQMCGAGEAFRVTALSSKLAAQQTSFMKLLALTKLKAFHWIT